MVVPSDRRKRSVFIPAAVFILSGVSHGLLLAVPFPRAEDQSEIAVVSAPEVESDDVTVVMLPPQKPAVLPEEVRPPEPEQTDQLLQTPVIDEPYPVDNVNNVDRLSNDALLSEESYSGDSEFFEDDPSLSEDNVTENDSQPSNVDPDIPSPTSGYSNDFPHLEGAVSGCFGVTDCRRVSSAGSYRSVARSLVDNLENNGYEVKLLDGLEDTGRNVYELSLPGSGGDIKYLMVFSDVDGSAVYVMSSEIMTLGDLQALQRPDNRRQSS